MLEIRQGNLFESDVDAVVNTVNTVGVMGKGIALQFKHKYPENFRAYEKASKAGKVRVGKMFTFDLGELSRPRFIINFPTKEHWRGASKLEYIETGLIDLVQEIKRLGIVSVALPALGCSNGGLAWSEVKPRILQALGELSEVRVLLFAPRDADETVAIEKSAKKPNLTLGRALMLKLIDFYSALGYSLGRLEAQKLAYFLQASGQDLKLTFKKHLYGPYAEAVNHVLESLEGHYIQGYGDRTGKSKIHLLPGVMNEVDSFLDAQPEALARLERVRQLIEGFETPYGMELLSSVHWLAEQEGIQNFEAMKTALRNWNSHKERLFDDDHHIEVTLQHLHDHDWVGEAKSLLSV